MTSQELNDKILANKGLVWYMLKKYFYFHRSNDDAYSCGLQGLWEAITNFDETKGKFSTYASRCIFNSVRRRFLDKQIRYEKRFAREEKIAKHKDSLVSSDRPSDLWELQDLFRIFPAQQRMIFTRLFLEKATQAEIVEETGMHKTRVSLLYTKGLEKLEQYLSKDKAKLQLLQNNGAT